VNPTVVGALVGLGLGSGLLLTISRVPAARRPRLDDRLAPYLDLPRNAVSGVGAWATAGGLLRSLPRRAGEVLGSAESVRRRLERAGRTPDVEAFRAEQLVWCAAGLLVGGALATVMWWRGAGSVGALLLMVVLAGLAGFVARDWVVGREVRRREERVLAEFPTVADLLALSVAAGEGALAAVERIIRISSGELSDELRRVVGDVRAGSALTEALGRLAGRTELPALVRFVDGVVVAVERGTPLADVLKAQAQDVREARRRALLEAAGRKEIAMMVPVVFLILPVTVLFAVFPGFAFLRLSL
jgi:tight adherence protein C